MVGGQEAEEAERARVEKEKQEVERVRLEKEREKEEAERARAKKEREEAERVQAEREREREEGARRDQEEQVCAGRLTGGHIPSATPVTPTIYLPHACCLFTLLPFSAPALYSREPLAIVRTPHTPQP